MADGPQLIVNLDVTRLFISVPPHARRAHQIYFLLAPDLNLVKIGFSNYVPQRISDIQYMSPARLDLLGCIPGTMADEAEMHRKYAHLRQHGEWFQFTPALSDEINYRCMIATWNAMPPESRLEAMELMKQSAARGYADIEYP